MQHFYYEDKDRRRAIMGVRHHDDVNCMPMDYYMASFALTYSDVITTIFEAKGRPEWVDDQLIDRLAYKKIEEAVDDMMHKSLPDIKLQQILAHTEWSKKQQTRLWKGLVLKPTDLLWFNWLAQQAGYLLDVYHIETIPSMYRQKHMPIVFREDKSGEMIKIGATDMSDGEMKAVLKQRRVQVVRVYHKDDVWHCIYGTYKGINGEESYPPHFHYISDKWGICREDLNKRIQANEMPSSVHILFKRTENRDIPLKM